MRFMTVLGAIWRKRSLVVFIYLDDVLVLGSSEAECREAVDIVLAMLRVAGFVLNETKSVLNPTQQVQYLGVAIDFF